MSETYDSIWSHLMSVGFTQAWVQAGDVSTRYIQAGSPGKPTVVFLHGIAGSWEAFCANIGPFAEHFQVFALDWIGAGFSDKPERPVYKMDDYVEHLHAFFEALGIGRASLVGVSMGGWTAVNFTHRYPDLVDRLVLCAASGMTRDPGVMPPGAASIRKDRAAAIANPTWENISNIFVDLIHDPAKRLPDFVKLRQTIYKMPEMKASMERILAIMPTEEYNQNVLADDEWRSIKAEALIIESSDDSEHFRRNSRRAHALLPNSELFPLSGVAHWPPFEDPAAFNRKAIEFLRAGRE